MIFLEQDGGENNFRKSNTSFNEGLKSIERRTLMKFKTFEIDTIIDYYANEDERLTSRLNRIRTIGKSDPYDEDLRDEQAHRISIQIDEVEERIKELEEFKKEM